MNAMDLISNIKWIIESTTELTANELRQSIAEELDKYDNQVAEDAIELEQLTREKADDAMLNHIGLKYKLTLNQVVGFMDLAETMNKTIGEGTGIVVVPFWFNEQYNELTEQNKALNEESQNLIATVERIKSVKVEDLESHVAKVELPTRSNIITGNKRPYIPGKTGPRLGDEGLDTDNSY